MKHKRSAYPDGLFTGSSDTNHAEVGTELFTCVVCREPKTRESYGIKRAKRRSTCKQCVNSQIRKCIDKQRADDPVGYKKRRCEYSKDWRLKNPELFAACCRKYQMRRKFGIGPEEFLTILAAQGGACAICKSDVSGCRDWSIDHDHETGAIRGLLCSACNLGLGKFRDCRESLMRAVRYLESGGAHVSEAIGRPAKVPSKKRLDLATTTPQ